MEGRKEKGGEERKHLAKLWLLKESADFSLTLALEACLRMGFAAETLSHSAFCPAAAPLIENPSFSCHSENLPTIQ